MIDCTWFTDGRRYVKVADRVIKALAMYERQTDRKERGGILLGRLFKKYDEILELVPPSTRDISSSHSFVRRKEPAQAKINHAWNISGGYIVYLGEWHTHPDNNPFPSRQDRVMIEHSLETTTIDYGHLYLIIGGKKGSLWIGIRNRAGLKALKLCREIPKRGIMWWLRQLMSSALF